MTYTHRFSLTPPGNPGSRLQAWGGAVLVHAAVLTALVAVWSESTEYNRPARPIEVRLVEATPPARPVPPPPRHPPPRPRPVPPPKPVAPEPPILTSTAETAPPVVEPAPVPVEPVPAVPVAPAAPPAPPAPPEPLVEARYDADYLANPKPPYPVASRRLGEEGMVRLRVKVGPNGRVLAVEVKTSSGFPRLDQSALATVAHWRFVPARRGTTPVTSWVVVPIIFSLT